MAKTFPAKKDQNDVTDWECRWASWLGNDTIATSTWTVPAGITKDSESNTTTVAKVWLSGGTDGQTYALLNRITTAAGRTADQTVNLKMKAR